MFDSCLLKQTAIIELFQFCSTNEKKYEKIIELGKKQRRMDAQYKIAENLVPGCQSIFYLRSWMDGDKIFFESDSDALISAGLGMLLLSVYSGETPETILKCTPAHLEVLNLEQSLTPGRANGLGAIYLRLKRDALRYLTAPGAP